MSGNLNHSPAELILELLITQGDATRYNAGLTWPIFYNFMPDTKLEGTSTKVNYNALATYDTTGLVQSRNQFDGRVNENHGVQIKVRSKSETVGRSKAKTIQATLDGILRTSVTISSDTYLIHSLARSGDVNRLGPRPETRSREFTLNYLVTVTLN